jgi:hypothetical protein
MDARLKKVEMLTQYPNRWRGTRIAEGRGDSTDSAPGSANAAAPAQLPHFSAMTSWRPCHARADALHGALCYRSLNLRRRIFHDRLVVILACKSTHPGTGGMQNFAPGENPVSLGSGAVRRKLGPARLFAARHDPTLWMR